MLFSVFQAFTADQTKATGYPEFGTGSLTAITFCALGAAGEIGEICNKVKKLVRDEDTLLLRKDIATEIGDVLYYLSQLACELDQSFQLIAIEQMRKMKDRRARGTVKGSGDNR